jgi:hypothetical protein
MSWPDANSFIYTDVHPAMRLMAQAAELGAGTVWFLTVHFVVL